MIYKSLKEEWPIQEERVWLRYTPDGVNYKEEVVAERSIVDIDCIGIPEWRSLEEPEWLSNEDKRALGDICPYPGGVSESGDFTPIPGG